MRYEKNKNGRDFIIGDLHGCYDMLMQKLRDVGFEKTVDRLFSVGDLTDRGPKNMKCLELLDRPWFFAVKGNHEVMMYKYVLDGESAQHWFMNGGDWFHEENTDDLERLCVKARELPVAITVMTEKNGEVGICHAQPPTDDWLDAMEPEGYQRESMLWGRNMYETEMRVKNIDHTIHGHTPMNNVHRAGNMTYVDTGAVYGGKLTILNLEEPL